MSAVDPGQDKQAEKAYVNSVLTETFDIRVFQRTGNTDLAVYVGALEGKCGSSLARTLSVSRQYIAYHLNRQEKAEWLKPISPNAKPKLYEKGARSWEADKLLKEQAFGSASQKICLGQGSEVEPPLKRVIDISPMSKDFLREGFPFTTVKARSNGHRVEVDAPILNKDFKFGKDLEPYLWGVKSKEMGSTMRHDGIFRSEGREWTIKVMGRTLTVWFRAMQIEDGYQLLHFKEILEEEYEYFKGQLAKASQVVLGRGRLRGNHLSFPNYSKAAEVARKYLFHSPEAWNDHSEGPLEWETSDYYLALVYYFGPGIINNLSERNEQHEQRIHVLEEQVRVLTASKESGLP